MRKYLLLVILMSLIAPPALFGQKADLLYKSGVIQLPNEEAKRGEIWIIAEFDGSLAIYFRKHDKELALKYGADDVVWFELTGTRKKYLSVPIKEREGEETKRRFAQIHYDGEYRLLSVLYDKETVYYLVDKSGVIIPLVNTYALPDPSNNFTIVYNYEFRSELVRLFREMPGIEERAKTIQYNHVSLSSFLEEYHSSINIRGIAYPTAGTTFSVGASAGYAGFRSVERIAGDTELGTSLVSVGISGEVRSTRWPVFGRAGIAFYKGYQQKDMGGVENFEYIIYTEFISNSYLTRFDVSGGLSFLNTKKLSPFLTVGGEYFTYLSYKSERITETFYGITNEMVTKITTTADKPRYFGGLKFELGADYTVNARSYLRCSASFHSFTGHRRIITWLNGFDFTISYGYNIF